MTQPQDKALINQTILMSDAKHIGIAGINAYEDLSHAPNKSVAGKQFLGIQTALRAAGITVEQVASPTGCQDGVYTANWAVTKNGRALLSRLPNARQAEEAYAETTLRDLGFETQRASSTFSGQGDVLLFNDHEAILGHGYRTHLTPSLLDSLSWLGVTPIIIRTKPRRFLGCLWRQRNRVSGLYDSYFYDIDLAVAVVAPNVLAVCLEALTHSSRRTILQLETRRHNPVTIIRVSLAEARYGFACNLVSTGNHVIMAEGAPLLAAELQRRGYAVTTVPNDQFKLTGGGVRCVSLTLNR
jgi:N-dimethylarginine dimethylaminohydrolase